MNTTTTTVIILLVVAWVVVRQFQPRPLKAHTLPIALAVTAIGGWQAVEYLTSGAEVGVGHAVAAVLGLALAVGLAYPRALTTKVFPGPDGRYLRQGTFPTLILWIVAIGGHIAVEFLLPPLFGDHTGRGLDGATITLFLGVTLLAQIVFLQRRVTAHRAGQLPVRA